MEIMTPMVDSTHLSESPIMLSAPLFRPNEVEKDC